jgi:hypothetical protein
MNQTTNDHEGTQPAMTKPMTRTTTKDQKPDHPKDQARAKDHEQNSHPAWNQDSRGHLAGGSGR